MKMRLSLAVLALAFGTPAFAQEAITESDLRVIDSNGYGIVTENEYAAYMDVIYDALDANNNGSISLAELSILLTPEQQAGIDPNRDGRITRAEFEAQMRRDFEAADRDGNGTVEPMAGARAF